jgi:phage FluMu protein Com
MASAAVTIRFTCPHCAKVLRTSTRPAQGKKVKCPACDEAFVPDLDDEEESTGIQERPSIKAKAKSSSKNRADEDEDDRPAKKRRRNEDDEDDEEDRPSRKKKKTKQKTGGNMMLVVLLLLGGGGLFLGVGLLALGAFVWPGFMLSKSDDKKLAKNNPDGKGGGENNKGAVAPGANLAAYVLPEATFVIGSNVKGFRDTNQLDALLGQFEKLPGANDALPREYKEIVRNCDKVLLSMNANALVPVLGGLDPFGPGSIGAPKGKGGPKGKAGPKGLPFGAPPGLDALKVAVAVLMSNHEAVEKIKVLPGIGPEEKLAGKYPVYRPKIPGNGPPIVVAFPSNRIIVVGSLNDQEMTAFLDNASKNEVAPGQLTKMTSMVEQSHFWAASWADAQAREQARQQMQAMQAMFQGQPGGMPQAGQDALQAMQNVKGSGFAVDSLPGGSWKAQLHFDCDDAKSAKALKDGGDLLKSTILGEMRKKLNDPTFPRTLEQDVNSLTFLIQGTMMSATVTISGQTITDIGKAIPGVGGLPNQGFKDFPKDFPKDPPKAGLPRPYTLFNLKDQSFDDRPFQFQQGRRVTIVVNNSSAISKSNADLYVFRDNTQNNANIIAFDERRPNQVRQPGECRVEFVVPATGTYYLRVLNRGPGVATFQVNLTQK